MNVQIIPIVKIVKGRNPRKRFDPEKLQELALSIKEHDLLQPIVVEPYKDGTYILVAGERRMRAHELLKRRNIKAVVRDRSNHNGRERFLGSIIENDQREDMNPIERGHAYRVLRDEYHMTTAEISRKTGKAPNVIDNHLLLTKLDPEIQELIERGFWKDARVARGLLDIEDKTNRVELARYLFNRKISLKGCLEAIRRTKNAIQEAGKKRKTYGQDRVPMLEIAEATEKPMRWDAIRQLGRVPEWELVVLAAGETCQACPLRDIASKFNCSDCVSVFLLRRLVEAAK